VQLETETAFIPISLGSLTINASIRIGSLLTTWTPDTISCLYDDERKFSFPTEFRSSYTKALDRRLSQLRAKGATVFDGPSYSLRDCRIEVYDPIEEWTRLELLLGPLTYFDFLASNLSVPTGDLSPRIVGKLPFLEIADLPLSNQLGINVSIVTADSRLVIQRRSRMVTHFAGQLANGVNATMQRGMSGHVGDETEDGIPDPILTIQRECREELGFTPDRDSVVIYGIAVEHQYFQPILIGEVRTPMSYDHLRSIAAAWARDKFEYRQLESLPLDPRTIARSLVTNHWVPICALTTVTTCVHHTTREDVTKALSASSVTRIG